MQVIWSREKEILSRDVQQFSSGPFLSCMEAPEGLVPGDYGKSVLSSKTTMAVLAFSVAQE